MELLQSSLYLWEQMCSLCIVSFKGLAGSTSAGMCAAECPQGLPSGLLLPIGRDQGQEPRTWACGREGRRGPREPFGVREVWG